MQNYKKYNNIKLFYKLTPMLVLTPTKKPQAFITALRKLTEQNLEDKDPHPFVECFFYSHPGIKKRIAAIVEFSGLKETGIDAPVREGA